MTGAELALWLLAREIGRDFEPDTPGDHYASLPCGVTAEAVDEIVAAAYEAWEMGLMDHPEEVSDKAKEGITYA
jgi:hypothetical protein